MPSSLETNQSCFEPGRELLFEPVGDLTAIAGYAASWQILTSETEDNNKLLPLVTKILNNRQMQIELGTRVYQLMQEDLYRQKERRVG